MKIIPNCLGEKRVSDIPTRSARPQRPALCASPTVLEPLPERRNTDAWSHISPEQNIHQSPRSVWRQFRDIWIRMAHTGSWGERCRSLKVRAESSYGVSQKDPRGASARANGAYLDAWRAAVIFQPVYCQFNELNVSEGPWKCLCCGG